jgi:hypothetical protein
MAVHPVAVGAAVLFVLAGIAVAVRGEVRARELERYREEILAAQPGRVREIESRLLNPSLDGKAREQLESELRDCKRGMTGIPRHFPGNERRSGYVWGFGLAAMGLMCLLYKPKAQT